jgi:acyl-CoA synthetase (AMP-forming)/AMP-acid ligase II
MNWYGAGYGLAEHVVFVSLLCDYVVSTRRGTDADDDKEFIACGHTKLLETSRTVIKIVNSETRKEVEEGVTGEIWISGPSKASGYYGKPQLSEETFRAKLASDGGVIADVEEYLCTGDLGFFQEGYLYIGGRRKDLIIVNGVNYYPQDIEYVVQEASMEVKGGCVAAFSADEMAKDGSLEIVFEVRSKNADYESLCSKVGSDVREKIGHSPSKIVILGENIPKTTSGKIRRRATREAVHLNQLHVLYYWADNDKQVGSTSAVKQKEDDVERGGQDVTSIFVGLLGEVYDENKTWEELGLSSMASIELQNLVVQNLGVAST